jgi:hypothetical protein
LILARIPYPVTIAIRLIWIRYRLAVIACISDLITITICLVWIVCRATIIDSVVDVIVVDVLLKEHKHIRIIYTAVEIRISKNLEFPIADTRAPCILQSLSVDGVTIVIKIEIAGEVRPPPHNPLVFRHHFYWDKTNLARLSCGLFTWYRIAIIREI